MTPAAALAEPSFWDSVGAAAAAFAAWLPAVAAVIGAWLLVPAVALAGWLLAIATPIAGPLIGAGAAILTVGLGQWFTYAREEAARLRREKRECVAQALAAWRDLETAWALEARTAAAMQAARTYHDEMMDTYGRSRMAGFGMEEEESGASHRLLQAGEEERPLAEELLAFNRSHRERADRIIKAVEPEYRLAVERLKARTEAHEDASHAQVTAERLVAYCADLLGLSSSPDVAAAYGQLTRERTEDLEQGQTQINHAAFMAAVRADMESVTVTACLPRGTMALAWLIGRGETPKPIAGPGAASLDGAAGAAAPSETRP